MQEIREKVALTVLLAALLVVLVWIGILVSARQRGGESVRFSDALWTMKHIAREEDP